MNDEQRNRMIELDAAAKAATEAQRQFMLLVYPEGCLVKVHHSRGAFNARVKRHSSDGHQLTVVNRQTNKPTYAYPNSSRTDTFRGEAWASSVEFLEGPDHGTP